MHLPAIISTQAGSNEEGRQAHLPGRTGSSESAAKATWGKLRMAGRNINVIQYITLISNLNRLFLWLGIAPGGIYNSLLPALMMCKMHMSLCGQQQQPTQIHRLVTRVSHVSLATAVPFLLFINVLLSPLMRCARLNCYLSSMLNALGSHFLNTGFVFLLPPLHLKILLISRNAGGN